MAEDALLSGTFDMLGRCELLEGHLLLAVAPVWVLDGIVEVQMTRVVGAGAHAGTASDALFLIDQDEAVLGPVARRGGTMLDAGGVLAVHAAHGHGLQVRVGVLADLLGVDVAPVHVAERAVDALAGHDASAAGHAARKIK